MTGTLKAKVNGEWVPIAGSSQDAASVARWNSAWGRVGTAVGTASVWENATTTHSEVTTTAGAYRAQANLLAGRRYRIYWQAQITSMTAGDLVVLQPRIGRPTTPFTYPSNVVERMHVANQAVECQFEGEYLPTQDGAYEFSMQARLGSGGVGKLVAVNMGNSNMIMTVDDVGPVVPVSVAPPQAQPRVVASGNALGVIAVGTLLDQPGANVPAATWTNLSAPLTATLALGRRYRVRFAVRAVQASQNVNVLYRLADNGAPWGERHHNYAGLYLHMADSWLIEGDGQAHTFYAQIRCDGGPLTVYTETRLGATEFYVEDVGPNSYPALPVPATPPAWTALVLENSWAMVASDGVPGYRKIGDVVTLRGMVAGGTYGQAITTLPVGFRPPSQIEFLAFMYVTTQQLVQLYITPGGALIAASPTGTANNISLSQVSFSTTP